VSSTVIVGADKVSPEQLRMLERARTGHVTDLFNALNRVVADGDILEGREELHPDWVDLFAAGRRELQERLPSRIYEQWVSFFAKLTPFDDALEELDPSAVRICFLLGAGASKPTPSGIPTVKELLPELLERARRLDREDVTKLAEFCERRRINNIEDLLTAAQLATFCSRNSTVLQLINYLLYRSEREESEEFPAIASRETVFMARGRRGAPADLSSIAFLQDTLQVLFGLLSSTMLPAKPNSAHAAIAEYARTHPGSSIVTTNYDCCMDLALGQFGKDLRYEVPFANQAPPSAADDCTRLIKLHGSLNWFYCETCQEVQLIDIGQAVDNFLNDRAPFPVIGICRSCGGQSRGLLVPPLAMKFDIAPPLTPLVSHAEVAFEKVDVTVVVGFSFAEADIYISRMLSKAMQASSKQRLVIADPETEVVERVRRKFKASIPNFERSRIVRMGGDCADTVPKFLSGQFVRARSSEETAHQEKVS